MVSIIVMGNVAQQQAGVVAVDDEPDVAGDTNGPEVLVLCLVQLVKAHTRMCRVQLQVERGHLCGLLLVAGQAAQDYP